MDKYPYRYLGYGAESALIPLFILLHTGWVHSPITGGRSVILKFVWSNMLITLYWLLMSPLIFMVIIY